MSANIAPKYQMCSSVRQLLTNDIFRPLNTIRSAQPNKISVFAYMTLLQPDVNIIDRITIVILLFRYEINIYMKW